MAPHDFMKNKIITGHNDNMPTKYIESKWINLLLIFYILILFLILLFPYQFSIPKPLVENSAEILSDGGGVKFGASGILHSTLPPAQLHQQFVRTGGMTVELWLRSDALHQKGPARIFSYSRNTRERNFTVAQSRNHLSIRFRTAATDRNGTPGPRVRNAFRPGSEQHVAVTYDSLYLRVFIDGELRHKAKLQSRVFDVWDPNHLLAFGNEIGGGRPWEGSIRYAALFDQALPQDLVQARFRAKYPPTASAVSQQPVLEFDFSSLAGEDGSTQRPEAIRVFSVPLSWPAQVATCSGHIFSVPIHPSVKMICPARATHWDILQNVLLFIPFGILVSALLQGRIHSTATLVLIAAASATGVSALCEALQIFLTARSSSIFDVAANLLGAVVGAWIFHLSLPAIRSLRRGRLSTH
jgi:glycopeptide antibiotics resistance protein